MGSSQTNHDGDIGFQIAPMVDVVFVLMLFFMACAGSQIIPKELRANLPAFGGGDHPAIVVEIATDGGILLNGQPFAEPRDRELSKLREWFRTVHEKFGDEDPVIIRPSAGTRHERLMDVLNAIQSVGVTKVAFS